MTLGEKIDEHCRWLEQEFTELHGKLNRLEDVQAKLSRAYVNTALVDAAKRARAELEAQQASLSMVSINHVEQAILAGVEAEP